MARSVDYDDPDRLVRPGCAGAVWHRRALRYFRLRFRCQLCGTTFQATTSEGPGWTLQQNQSIGVGSGFPTKLRQGTRWQLAGRTPQGDVYRTGDQIVTVEASNIFEAMVVIVGDKLTGFYLPVDHCFVAATDQVTLPITRSTQK